MYEGLLTVSIQRNFFAPGGIMRIILLCVLGALMSLVIACGDPPVSDIDQQPQPDASSEEDMPEPDDVFDIQDAGDNERDLDDVDIENLDVPDDQLDGTDLLPGMDVEEADIPSDQDDPDALLVDVVEDVTEDLGDNGRDTTDDADPDVLPEECGDDEPQISLLRGVNFQTEFPRGEDQLVSTVVFMLHNTNRPLQVGKMVILVREQCGDGGCEGEPLIRDVSLWRDNERLVRSSTLLPESTRSLRYFLLELPEDSFHLSEDPRQMAIHVSYVRMSPVFEPAIAVTAAFMHPNGDGPPIRGIEFLPADRVRDECVDPLRIEQFVILL